MRAQQPKNESERLAVLRQFSILDSFTEKDYDDITHMASIICDTPVALISFVDQDRQWFKSHLGVDATQTPREQSFCAHAILNVHDALVVEDSRLDLRFMDNPLVTGDPNIVFYAGIPLVSDEGYGLGTVCVIDTKPKTLTEQQIVALRILSRQVMHLLQLRKVNKQLDEQSKQLEHELEIMVSDRVREMEEKNANLEKMNKELQAFNYISSHDLQEPLRKIQTFTSMIVSKESDNISDKGKEYLAKIEMSSARMRALITDLLAYSRTTFAEKVFQDIFLCEVVEQVVSNLEEEIEEKRAKVELICDCEIKIIPYQIQQLIYNLVSNSLKFSRPGVLPVIKISCQRHEDKFYSQPKLNPSRKYFRITVNDNGIGFDNAYNEKIFELFQRLGNREIQLGTGIGLAIVKKIVENHDGIVVANGQLGQGTTFEIYIPETQIRKD